MNELNISVADILGRPGRYKEFAVSAVLEGISTRLARLAASPVHAELRAESVVEGVLVSGSVRAEAVLECARCMASFPGDLHMEVCELFVSAAHPDALEDAYRIVAEEVGLEPMLRDVITLSLPLNPVCRSDCRGLCSICGRDLNDGACEHPDETIDPRWAALSSVRDRLET